MLIELLSHRYPGMRLWLSQRLTAVYMAVYLFLLVLTLCLIRPTNYVDWHSYASHWLFKFSSLVFIFCLAIHAWVGVRDVLRDYVFNLTTRAVCQLVVELLLAAYLIWFCAILWHV